MKGAMRSRRCTAGAFAGAFVLWCFANTASSQVPNGMEFEVASVKPNNSPEGGAFLPRPGSFSARNLSLRTLTGWAYQIQEFLIDDRGQPRWFGSDRWDVNAKPPANVTGVRPFPEMLQKLLAQRFALRARRETRQMPIYTLQRVRPDRLGPKLTPFAGKCRTAQENEGDFCRLSIRTSSIQAVGIEWGFLPGQLTGSVRRNIVDRTGLTGRFTLTLQWTPELAVAPDVDDRVSLFTALEEQLGLTLESSTGPVEVLVIEHIDRPIEN